MNEVLCVRETMDLSISIVCTTFGGDMDTTNSGSSYEIIRCVNKVRALQSLETPIIDCITHSPYRRRSPGDKSRSDHCSHRAHSVQGTDLLRYECIQGRSPVTERKWLPH